MKKILKIVFTAAALFLIATLITGIMLLAFSSNIVLLLSVIFVFLYAAWLVNVK